MQAIAVLDHSINALFIYDVPKEFDVEQMEEFLHEQGRHLSNCSWGEFDGTITDLRNE